MLSVIGQRETDRRPSSIEIKDLPEYGEKIQEISEIFKPEQCRHSSFPEYSNRHSAGAASAGPRHAQAQSQLHYFDVPLDSCSGNSRSFSALAGRMTFRRTYFTKTQMTAQDLGTVRNTKPLA
jgi:hypothetical protein